MSFVGRGWNFKEFTAHQPQVHLKLSWGSVRGSYCSNIDLCGLTWGLLYVPIRCMHRGAQPQVKYTYKIFCLWASAADPDFYPSRIQKQQQKRGVKNNLLSYLFCSHKFHKTENYLIFEMLKKKISAYLQRILELFTHKIVSTIWVGIRKKPIPDPGVKKAPDPGSGTLLWAELAD